MSDLLDKINTPKDLKKLSVEELSLVSEEIRKVIIDVISDAGGHLASSLGAVELIVCLHYVLNTPDDYLIWDVGHQAYAHKILTGRKNKFATIRTLGGLSGFPNANESPYDVFTVGHSSTSISQALGLAVARDLKNESKKVIAIIGDASLATGLAFEGLNHAGHLNKDLLVILNDNKHSISKTVGALSAYLNKIVTTPGYNKIRDKVENDLKKVPKVGPFFLNMLRKAQESVKSFLLPGFLFEELGFRYFGPIDGHNVEQLVKVLNNVTSIKGAKILHIITRKGKGFRLAEEVPGKFHGISPTLKNIDVSQKTFFEKQSFTSTFGKKIVEIAQNNKKILAVTAAMCEGTGLEEFSEKFPDRFFDVGIAEGHAVTFASGLTKGGFKPFIAVYSTFLQRAYDQIIHDICLQKLPIVLCIDRAGLVGEDGPTHHGLFTINYLRHLPNMTLMAPKDQLELESMLEFAAEFDKGPVAIYYPRGALLGKSFNFPAAKIEYGKAEILRKGNDMAVISVGSLVHTAFSIAENLHTKDGIQATVVNARFVKPLDTETFENIFTHIKKAVIIEETVVQGGFGSAVLEYLSRENITDVKIKIIGLPSEFIEHGARKELLKKYHLDEEGIYCSIKSDLLNAYQGV